MDVRTELEKRLEKQRSVLSGIHSQIAELQGKADTVEAIIKELESLYKALPRDSSGVNGNGSSPVEMTLRRNSDVWKAREALREFKQPTEIDKILEKSGKEPTKENRRSLASQMSWYARKNKIFKKLETNVFGLLEWDARKEEVKESAEVEADVEE
jgi:hypothetical protein